MSNANQPADDILSITDCARICGEDCAAQSHDSKPWTGDIFDADITWTEEQIGHRMTVEEAADFTAAFRTQYNHKVGAA